MTNIVPSRRRARAVYDFAVDGGAVGDIPLRGDKIPSGAIITDVLIHVDTVLTSGGAATVALKAESAADLNAADAISGAPWSSAGAKRGDLTATSAPVKTTAERQIVATVATAVLTAGKFSAHVEYLVLPS
ncbi:MAG: hypothetical protein M3364_04005 [Actinomycetota bacterium]|nr:hypothetical protein [Actinomycetota bacterium]